MRGERELSRAIFAAAMLCRAAIRRSTFGPENPDDVVEQLDAAWGVMIGAVHEAGKGIARGLTDKALLEIHRLGENASTSLGAYVAYVRRGGQEAGVIFEEARRAPNKIDLVIGAYEIAYPPPK